MQDLIDRIEAAIAPVPLRANRTRENEECVVYDWYSTAFDGARREIILKVQTYAPSMVSALEIQNKIDSEIVLPGDRHAGKVRACAQNGGGWLQDGEMHCRISYYNIIIKEG